MKELKTKERRVIAVDIDDCPLCSGRGVTYRSSPASLTMRCGRCGLQWTCTYVKIEQAVTWLAENVEPRYERMPSLRTEPQRRKWLRWWVERSFFESYTVFTGKRRPSSWSEWETEQLAAMEAHDADR
jgi:hypothetical protein